MADAKVLTLFAQKYLNLKRFSEFFCGGITKLALWSVSTGKASFAIPTWSHYFSENRYYFNIYWIIHPKNIEGRFIIQRSLKYLPPQCTLLILN